MGTNRIANEKRFVVGGFLFGLGMGEFVRPAGLVEVRMSKQQG